MPFPKNFVWGTATSAYQIEGAAYADGKGPSIWDRYTRQPGRVFEGHTGDVACDHYHLFRKDVELMKEMGVKAYRFSVAWSRVVPCGEGEINRQGLRFYSELVDVLLENGITPYVTLYHWDLPYALHLRGGWLNPESPKWFSDYATVVGKALGDRVKHFITFNEPQVFIGNAFVHGEHAPGFKLPRSECLQMAHHVLLAHGAAVRALRNVVPEAQIGFAPTSNVSVPNSECEEDIEAARSRYFYTPASDDWAWSVAWWSDPVLLGHYPEDGLRALHADMPKIDAKDMLLIAQPIDFYGQNIYRGDPVRASKEGTVEALAHPVGGPKTAIGWHVNFDCLYWGTKFLYERYKKPIYITENGMSSHDWPALDGKIHDLSRIDYLHRHLLGLRRAVEEGIQVSGYFQWSLMDNFEWARGYHDRFGLIYVDYQTQERIPKDSFFWYKKVIETNGSDL